MAHAHGPNEPAFDGLNESFKVFATMVDSIEQRLVAQGSGCQPDLEIIEKQSQHGIDIASKFT